MATITISALRQGSAVVHRQVEASVFGAWAAHPDAYGIDFTVTFLRFGLAVPYAFETLAGAKASAKAINALSAEWGEMTGEDIKARYGKAIMAVCAKRPGNRSDGPKGPMVPLSEQQPVDAAAAE